MLFFGARYNIPFNLSVEAKNFFTATLFLLAVYLLPFIQEILETRLMQYLGKISFSLFLIHWPVLGSLTSYLFIKTQHLPYMEQFYIVFSSTTFTVIILSCLSKKIIENFLSTKIIQAINNRLFPQSKTTSLK